MSQKQARQKKMVEVEAGLAAQKSMPTAKPALVITPQIAVALQGTAPDQGLWIEAPNSSGSRHKVELTPATAYAVLMDLLLQKAADIELERVTREAAKAKAKRQFVQPDWETIARHPEAHIIQRLPTRAAELRGNKSEASLEDMGL